MSKGFTIIEVLVSISILTIIVGIPFGILGNFLTANQLTQESVRANFINQEILEHVRNDRDNAFLRAGANWFVDLKTPNSKYNKCLNIGTTDRYCNLTRDTDGFINGVASSDTRGNNNDTCDGKPTESIFTETLDIDFENDAAIITACVSWETVSNEVKKVETKTILFEWIKKIN